MQHAARIGLVLMVPFGIMSAIACEPLQVPTAKEAGCAPVPEGIVSWWPGDGSPIDVERRNDGMPEGPVGYAPGLVGQAFSFNGTDDIVATTNGFPVLTQDRTIEMWIYLTSEGNPQDVLTFAFYGQENVNNEVIQFGASANAWDQGDGGVDGGITLAIAQWGNSLGWPSLSLDKWYHVAVTVTSQDFQLYLNGEPGPSKQMPMLTPEGTLFFIGGLGLASQNDGWQQLFGLADEVSIYNRALSPAEIKAIYQAGSRGKCRS